MDVIEILRKAEEKLPHGEHSVGITAILRHLETAIRHYQRDPLDDPDCYTDSIYRTNQAYEGSLKEAYRVIAKRDPSGKTPNEIERYLEENKILRPRVLVQLTRYRQDFRNPSTHDYKLDFDVNESLISILTVAAFCKLLMDQISEKIAFEKSLSAPSISSFNMNGTDDELLKRVSEYIRDFCNDDDKLDLTDDEFEASLAGSLTSLGFVADSDYDSELWWDLVISHTDKKFSIETRFGDNRHSTNKLIPAYFVVDGVVEDNLNGGIVVSRMKQRGNYAVLKISNEGNQYFYLISKMDKSTVSTRLGKKWVVSFSE